jgi:hypothetical protein
VVCCWRFRPPPMSKISVRIRLELFWKLLVVRLKLGSDLMWTESRLLTVPTSEGQLFLTLELYRRTSPIILLWRQFQGPPGVIRRSFHTDGSKRRFLACRKCAFSKRSVVRRLYDDGAAERRSANRVCLQGRWPGRSDFVCPY